MNLRKGFFRLTLVLSIFCGILAIYFWEEISSGIRSSRDIGITIYLPSDWGDKTIQEKLDSIDELLIMEEKDEKRKGTRATEKAYEEAWRGLRRKLSLVEYSKLTSREQQNVKRRLRDQIIFEEKKLPKDRERQNYYVSSGSDWKEISFLLFISFLIGFAPVWLIYAFMKWIVIGFIVGGFKGKSRKGGETD